MPLSIDMYKKHRPQLLLRRERPNDITHNVITSTTSGTPQTLLNHNTEQQLIAWAMKMEEMCIPVDLTCYDSKQCGYTMRRQYTNYSTK
jgi:hypothetical protein